MSDRVEPGEALELRRGRPRDASIDQAILDAAQELVGQVGYARMSIDLVARRAGVTRPTVYLRWRNKPELVHAALFRRSNRWPDTGDLRGDLIVIARRSAKAWAVPGVRAALLGLLADAAVDDELHAAVMASILGPTKAWLVRLFASAAARWRGLRHDRRRRGARSLHGTALPALRLQRRRRPDVRRRRGRRAAAKCDVRVTSCARWGSSHEVERFIRWEIR